VTTPFATANGQPESTTTAVVRHSVGRRSVTFGAYSAARHQPRRPRRYRQAALAHRARLPGAEIRIGSGPLRGAGVARFPPPCHPRHRGLWLPHPRTRGLSPLSRHNPPRRCRSRSSTTQRRPRSGRNDTCQTQSQPYASGSPSPWRLGSLDVLAATDGAICAKGIIYDAVELGAPLAHNNSDLTTVDFHSHRVDRKSFSIGVK
jgi:hypothetical protein